MILAVCGRISDDILTMQIAVVILACLWTFCNANVGLPSIGELASLPITTKYGGSPQFPFNTAGEILKMCYDDKQMTNLQMEYNIQVVLLYVFMYNNYDSWYYLTTKK